MTQWVDSQSEMVPDNMPILGSVVWYQIRGPLIRESVVDDVISRGWPEEWVPKITAKSAFTKTIGHLRQEEKKWLIDKVADDQNRIVYAVAEKLPDEAHLRIDLEHRGRVTFWKTSEEVVPSGEVPQEVTETYARALIELQTSELQGVALNVIRSLSAISVRESGGIYFIPKAYSEATESLRDMLEGWHQLLYILPIADMEQGRFSLVSATDASFRRDLDEMEKDMEILVERYDEGLLGPRQVRTRLGRYQALMRKGEVYQLLVDLKLTATRAALQSMVETLERLSGQNVGDWEGAGEYA